MPDPSDLTSPLAFENERRRSKPAQPTLISSHRTTEAVVGDINVAAGTRAALTDPVEAVPGPVLQPRPESAFALRRVLFEARNALLDKRDVSGPLGPVDQTRLREIDTELDALAKAEVRRTASQDVWAKLDALANRVVAMADVEHDPQ